MSLYSADAFLRFPPGYGIPIQKNTVLSGHLPMSTVGSLKLPHCVRGGGCGRLAKCTGTYLLLSRGTTEVVGGPGQPGEKSHDFLGSGTTKNPDIVLTAVWLVETCRFSNNFGKF